LRMKKLFAMMLCLMGLCACGTANIKTSESDPYSYVVKAYSLIDTHFLYGRNGWSEEDFAQGFQMRPEGAFNNVRDGMYTSNGVCDNLNYALLDIDGNGTKELLLGVGSEPDIGLIEVYAIQDGVAVQQAFSLSYCADCGTEYPTLLKNGTIWSIRGGDQITVRHSYYRFADEQLKLQMKLTDTLTDDAQTSFFRFDDLISQEEYERLRKEFEDDGQEAEIDWKPLANYVTR